MAEIKLTFSVTWINVVESFRFVIPSGKSHATITRTHDYAFLSETGNSTIEYLTIDSDYALSDNQKIKMQIKGRDNTWWYCYFDYQGHYIDLQDDYNNNKITNNNLSLGNFTYSVKFSVEGEYQPPTGGGEDPDPDPDIPEQPEIPEQPPLNSYTLLIRAQLGDDGSAQIYKNYYEEGTELNPYEDIYNPSQWENIKNAYEGYQYSSGLDNLDTDIVMDEDYTFDIIYHKIPEAETQTMTMVIVNNCKGFKVTDSSSNNLLKGANSEGIVVGKDSVYENQIKELTRDVMTGEILTLTHYGYTSTDAKWYQFNGWYYIDNSGEPVDLGNKRTITFQVPPVGSWGGAVYCEATKISSGTFDWDEAKVAGYQFNLTANEWLRLVDYIEAKKNDGGSREYYKDQIKFNHNFTAQMFNAVAVELGLTVRGREQIIKASYFDEIKKAANNMKIEDIWT